MLLLTIGSGALVIQARFDMRPEQLLAHDERVLSIHKRIQKTFGLHDLVVLCVVNEQQSEGLFNLETLKKVYTLSKFAATLIDPKDPARRVIGQDIIALDNVDTISQAGPNQARFDWLMKEPPSSREEALKIRDAALKNPFLKGTLVSANGKALAMYLPISKKDFAYTVAERLRAKINELGTANGDEFHITGLPVAEGMFGKEMFVQMKRTVPLLSLTLFFTTLLLFRNVHLSLSLVVLSACTVTATMGLLVGTGHALNSINSQLPIFIMPAAVLGAVHIMSRFVDSWHRFQDAEETIRHVMNELFVPLFFTPLIFTAGAASFAAATPLQPFRDFGIFASIGMLFGWLLNIFFIPACLVTIKDSRLEGLCRRNDDKSLLNRHLIWISKISSSKPWFVISFHIVIAIVGVIGLLMIQVNGNPMSWFAKKHEIQRADQVLARYFGGISEAYLVLSGKVKEQTVAEVAELLNKELEPLQVDPPALKDVALSSIAQEASAAKTGTELLDILNEAWNSELDKISAEDKTGYAFWTTTVELLSKASSRKEIFKRPDVLRYLANFQAHIAQQGDVAKSSSISDLVKKVHQELYQGNPQYFTIPDKIELVADILTFFSEQP
ncbi:MMPL family transporter [Desulfobulbus sp. F3]|nr:MMPL family transporter [Desulfobulbus sp. F3]